MDAADAHSLAAIGAILEAQDDVLGALSSYERARAIDPAEVPDAVLARVRARAALAKLPAQYRAIPAATSVSRADIAALIGNRLEALVARARPRQAIITDIRGQWAADVDQRRRPRGHHGHAAELPVRSRRPRPARRPGAHGLAGPHVDRRGEARSREEVDRRPRPGQRRGREPSELPRGVGRRGGGRDAARPAGRSNCCGACRARRRST